MFKAEYEFNELIEQFKKDLNLSNAQKLLFEKYINDAIEIGYDKGYSDAEDHFTNSDPHCRVSP